MTMPRLESILAGALALSGLAPAAPSLADTLVPLAPPLAAPVGARAIESEVSGEVTVVNPQTRLMTIKTPTGHYEVLHVPPGVAGLDKVDVGDRVRIAATETVLTDIAIGTEPPAPSVYSERTIESAGSGSAATVIDRSTLYGRVLKVDKSTSTITVQGAQGTVDMRVRDPMLLEAVAPGDTVITRYRRVVTGEIET